MEKEVLVRMLVDAIAALQLCASMEMQEGLAVILADQVAKLEEVVDTLDV